MPNVTAGYERLSFLVRFFGHAYYILLHACNIMTSSNFYKLCVEAEVYGCKVNLCNHLCLCQSIFFPENVFLHVL